MSEHDFEPVRGLPGDLPEGEHIIWQGAPQWTSLARRLFHVPIVALYFLGLMAWRVAGAVSDGASAGAALQSALWVAPLALVALSMLAGLAWLNARTTVYTITNKRIVMRFGAALTKAINIPFGIVESASLQVARDGGGDLALTLVAPNKIAYLQLWPHARPGKLSAPQPTFRGIANAARVSEILSAAVRDASPAPDLIQKAAPASAESAPDGATANHTPAMA